MHDDYMHPFLLFLIAAVICFLLSVGMLKLLLFLGSYECSQKWPDTPHRFGLVSGCMIETKDGIYIPEKNYRSVE
jgi:hypothetical protein